MAQAQAVLSNNLANANEFFDLPTGTAGFKDELQLAYVHKSAPIARSLCFVDWEPIPNGVIANVQDACSTR